MSRIDIETAEGPAHPLGGERLDKIDPFDRVQHEFVVATCRESRSLSEAGRILFENSRKIRKSTTDADRLT